jgi:hypothetical protein
MKDESPKRTLLPSGMTNKPTLSTIKMNKSMHGTLERPRLYGIFVEQVDGKDKLVPAHT